MMLLDITYTQTHTHAHTHAHTRTHTHSLAGLCRTCEIFGVLELVVGSTTVLEEKQFKSLSVTSEKWQKITEVIKPHPQSMTCLQ